MLRKLLGVFLVITGISFIGIQVWQWYSQYQLMPISVHKEQTTALGTVAVKKRSVVLVTMDTTRADHLQPYGALNTRTPVLQSLADNGILFHNAMAVAPITLPAHTSINTGLYQYQHGIHNNGTQYVPDSVTTLAERLKAEGYQTAAFISAEVLSKNYGLDQGFDLYDDDLSTSASRLPRMVPDRPGNFTVDSAIEWLEKSDTDQPFFIWVHFYDPHAAYNPPPPYRQEYQGRPYDGEIAFMDSQIGRLLEHERIANTKDLIISVMGDHGESFGEHGERTHAILAYQATMHIPWIMQIKDGPKGVKINPAVSQVDFAPTILGLTGIEPDPELLGLNIFSPQAVDLLAERTIYAESYLPYYSYGWAKLHVARQNNWKYIEAPQPELYDLSRDPYELTNLIDQNSNTAFDLENALTSITSGFSDNDSNQLDLDTDALERLRGLGYIAMGSVSTVPDDQRPDPKAMIRFHVGLERARALSNDGLLEQAEEVLDEVLQNDQNNIAALVDLTQVYLRMNKLDEASDILIHAIGLDPDYRRLQVMMATIENRKGAHDKALLLLEAVIEKEPRETDARLSLINTLITMKQRDKAKKVLEAGLELSPDNPKFNLKWATLVDMPANPALAEERVRSAISRDPFLSSAWLKLGDLQNLQGQTNAALATYREGLQKNPDDATLHGRLGVLLSNIDPASPGIENHLREAIRLTDQSVSEYHLALGAWYAKNNNSELAQQQYALALNVDPSNPAAVNNQAIALYQAGKVQEALDNLNELVKKYPKHVDAHNNLAALAIDQRQWGLAEKEAEVAVSLKPDLFEAWSNLALARDNLNKTDLANTAYQKTLELNPDYWQARVNYGIHLMNKGALDQAEAEFRLVLKINPTSADTHFSLANIAEGKGDRKTAKKHYNLFLKYAPGDPRSQQVLEKLEQ